LAQIDLLFFLLLRTIPLLMLMLMTMSWMLRADHGPEQGYS